MLENSTTVRAETVDKAVKIGLTRLGITEAEAKINIISEGKKGIFGFGKQDAIVEISTESDLSMAELTTQLEKEIQAAEAAENDLQTEKESKVAPVEKKNEKPTNAPKPKAKPVAPKTVEPTRPSVEKVKPQPTVKKTEAEPKLEKSTKKTVEGGPIQPTEKVESESNLKKRTETNKEARLIVVRYLEDVLESYGAEAKVTYKESGNQVIFNIVTNKSGLVIGKHGKIINALQTLAQILLHRHDRRRVSVILNVGDYRDRRSNILDQIAERTADQVLQTKQAVILDPLPAYERKQIHAYLSRLDHIKTHSEGKDPNRYLVVEYVN